MTTLAKNFDKKPIEKFGVQGARPIKIKGHSSSARTFRGAFDVFALFCDHFRNELFHARGAYVFALSWA
jgi:hypothetical protein